MRSRILLTLVEAFVLMGIQYSAFASNLCTTLLVDGANGALTEPRAKIKLDGTDGLIAYLSDLLEHQDIGDTELSKLMDSLEKGEISNPIHEKQTWISSAAMIHREEIQDYIRGTEIDQKRLFEWAKKSVNEKERVRELREEIRTEIQDIHQKIEFNRVLPGRFQMGDGQRKVTVNLTHPFEAMSAPVTQKQWVEIMGENPSKFVDGDQTTVVIVQGKEIKMLPDNPVEQVTWWSVVEYANRLSKKMGLAPAYDLSGVKFKEGTSAEAGTWAHLSGKVKINAPGGDIYQAEGIRLLTEAESQYLRRLLGKANGLDHFGDDEADLKDHAWFSANSGRRTHPVAQLKPLTHDRMEFFDLIGNVWEWNHDLYANQLKGGDNPQGAKRGSVRVRSGGSYDYDAQFLRSDYRDGGAPSDRSSGVGFRLGRTIK